MLLMLLEIHLGNKFGINTMNRYQPRISDPQINTFLEPIQYFWYLIASNLSRLQPDNLPQ